MAEREVKINAIPLLNWLKFKRVFLKDQNASERYIALLNEIIGQVSDMIEKAVECNLYDEVETYPNCTVQILRNSVTGDVSVGWVKNE